MFGKKKIVKEEVSFRMKVNNLIKENYATEPILCQMLYEVLRFEFELKKPKPTQADLMQDIVGKLQ
jgi:hypothetical protein